MHLVLRVVAPHTCYEIRTNLNAACLSQNLSFSRWYNFGFPRRSHLLTQ